MSKLFGKSTIYGVDGEHRTPYMTRYKFWRLRLHIFHRGDADPDCHDHPWPFWTFPLTSYVEQVATPIWPPRVPGSVEFSKRRQVVPAFQLSFRPAEHCHRVTGRYSGFVFDAASGEIKRRKWFKIGRHQVPMVKAGKIITIVWEGGVSERPWGFLRNRDGRWCWTPWREYVFGGGKHAPCEPEEKE